MVSGDRRSLRHAEPAPGEDECKPSRLPRCYRFIWARYSLVIIPKNWALFAVNFFVGLSGSFQLAKVVRYQRSLKDAPLEETAG